MRRISKISKITVDPYRPWHGIPQGMSLVAPLLPMSMWSHVLPERSRSIRRMINGQLSLLSYAMGRVSFCRHSDHGQLPKYEKMRDDCIERIHELRVMLARVARTRLSVAKIEQGR